MTELTDIPRTTSKKPRKMTEFTDIPDNIIFQEIFLRLPVKTLCIIKTVCRQWNVGISSLNFAHTHLRHPYAAASVSSKHVLAHRREYYKTVLRTVTLDDDQNRVDSSFNIKSYTKNFSLPFKILLSSCNGLAFLISSPRLCWCKGHQYPLPACVHLYQFRYVVCNPILGGGGISSGDFVEVDHPKEILLGGAKRVVHNNHLFNFGFGYVSSLSDYYIVVVNFPWHISLANVVVHTYSIRSQEWKEPRKFRQYMLPLKFQDLWYNHIGTLVNEILYWVVTRGKGDRCIAAFDLATQDEFKLMEVGSTDLSEGGREFSSFSLCCMDDCLCAFTRYVDENEVVVWKMQGRGLCGTWTESFRFVANHFNCLNVFPFTNDDRMFLIFTKDHSLINSLKVLDLRLGLPQRIKCVPLKSLWITVDYVPSLVSVRSLVSEPRE